MGGARYDPEEMPAKWTSAALFLTACLSGGPLCPVGRCPLVFVSRDSGTNIASGGGQCTCRRGGEILATYVQRSVGRTPWSRAVKKKGCSPPPPPPSPAPQLHKCLSLSPFLSLCFPHLLSWTNRSGAWRSPFFLSVPPYLPRLRQESRARGERRRRRGRGRRNPTAKGKRKRFDKDTKGLVS